MEIYGTVKNRKTNTDEYHCNNIYSLINICENFENEKIDIKKLYQIELLFPLTDEYFTISDFQKDYNVESVSKALKKISENSKSSYCKVFSFNNKNELKTWLSKLLNQ